MPGSSEPLDVERLADAGAEVDFVVPLAELAALREGEQVAGEVSGRVQFVRVRGVPVAAMSLSGTAQLECQRCLQPLKLRVDAESRIALVGSQQQAQDLPQDLEPVLAEGGRISIAALVTEELLLSLPIVPLHGPTEACAGRAEEVAAERGGERQQPFAQLAELLKR